MQGNTGSSVRGCSVRTAALLLALVVVSALGLLMLNPFGKPQSTGAPSQGVSSTAGRTALPSNRFVEFEITPTNPKPGMTVYIKPGSAAVRENNFAIYLISTEGNIYTAEILGASESLNEITAFIPYTIELDNYLVFVIANRNSDLSYKDFIENGEKGRMITISGWPQRPVPRAVCPPDSMKFEGPFGFEWCIKINLP